MRFLLSAVLCLATSLSYATSPALKNLLESSPISVAGTPLRAPVAVKRFYALNGYRAAWINNTRRRDQLLAAIETAVDHGLDPNNYHRAALSGPPAFTDLNMELLATDAWLTLAGNILGGQLDPITMEPNWTAARRERDLAAHLQTVLEADRIIEGLTELEPDAPAYQTLKQALKVLRNNPAPTPTQLVPGGALLKPGMTSTRVPLLRRKLGALGYAVVDSDDPLYDPELVETVKAWQRQNGLEADGIVGENSLALLNLADSDRIRMLRVNMERWRWLPENLGERHVRVNIANFRLEARNRGAVEREHAIIVGRPYRETPIFSNQIRYMIFNPWWETPPNIARKDKLPDFQKNPAKVKELGFEVYDTEGNKLDPDRVNWHAYRTNFLPLRLRQRPGPQNALGQVKIMFPNPHSVYLHDTPSRELFAKTRRNFSSGCVRVQHATELASWLLSDNPESDRQRVAAVLASGAETRINLTKPVPVHILYFTAITGENNRPRYLYDIYSRDDRIANALNTR